MTDKLKPCPKCLSDNVALSILMDSGSRFVICNACGIMNTMKSSTQEAVDDWNDRLPPAKALQALVEMPCMWCVHQYRDGDPNPCDTCMEDFVNFEQLPTGCAE